MHYLCAGLANDLKHALADERVTDAAEHVSEAFEVHRFRLKVHVFVEKLFVLQKNLR
jgi:hypothetical protein